MRLEIFGCPIDDFNFTSTVDQIIELAEARKGGHQVSLNTLKILEFKKNPIVVKAMETASIVSADGLSIVIALRILNSIKIERVAGIDLAEEVIERCSARNLKVYLLGSSQNTITNFVAKLLKSNSLLEIVGYRNGFWSLSEEETVMQNIADSGANICLIALPSPQKEILIVRHREKLKEIFLLPVGGAFEIFVGSKKRAPKFIQMIGMEWFYRLIQEPKRLLPRYLKANGFFFFKLISELYRRILKRILKSK